MLLLISSLTGKGEISDCHGQTQETNIRSTQEAVRGQISDHHRKQYGDKYVEHVRKDCPLSPLVTKTGTALLIGDHLTCPHKFFWPTITSYWDSQIDISAVITCSGGNLYMAYFQSRDYQY